MMSYCSALRVMFNKGQQSALGGIIGPRHNVSSIFFKDQVISVLNIVTPWEGGGEYQKPATHDELRAILFQRSRGFFQSSVYWARSFAASPTPTSPPQPTAASGGMAASPIAAQDFSPMLKKLSYQVSSPMPNLAPNAGSDETGSGAVQGSGKITTFTDFRQWPK